MHIINQQNIISLKQGTPRFCLSLYLGDDYLVNTKEVIAATGLADNEDLQVLNAIRSIAAANGDSAFNLDRMIWLICSGYYFLDDYRDKPHKKDLIKKIYSA